LGKLKVFIEQEFFKMKEYSKEWLKLSIIIISILMIGTLGYYFLEDGWSLLDAFYMVIISITTVGYGEIHELSPAGRVFTIFLILSGLGVAATTMTKVAKFLLEGEIKGAFRRKRVSKKISKL